MPATHQIGLDGRHVDYRVVASRSARKLRIRVGLNGIEVVQPIDRADDEVMAFLKCNGWILMNFGVERLRKIRVPERQVSEILFRGEQPRFVSRDASPAKGNRVTLIDGEIVVRELRIYGSSVAQPGELAAAAGSHGNREAPR